MNQKPHITIIQSLHDYWQAVAVGPTGYASISQPIAKDDAIRVGKAIASVLQLPFKDPE